MIVFICRLSNDLTEFGYKMAVKSDNQERGIKRRHIDTKCFVSTKCKFIPF